MSEEKAKLGLATTRELLAELTARIEVDGKLDYKTVGGVVEFDTPVVEERVLPEGKRVVRTKTSGDRVYLIDENAKTRQWLTNPEALASQGFEPSDVAETTDEDLLKYSMGSPINA
jgi:hypothetical protein